jgi:hypothetical protein
MTWQEHTRPGGLRQRTRGGVQACCVLNQRPLDSVGAAHFVMLTTPPLFTAAFPELLPGRRAVSCFASCHGSVRSGYYMIMLTLVRGFFICIYARHNNENNYPFGDLS